MLILISIVRKYHKKVYLQRTSIVLLTVIAIMNIIGIGFYIENTRLVDLYLIKRIIRLDQLTYLISGAALSISAFILLNKKIKNPENKKTIISFISLGIVLGIIGLWEILQLMEVLFLNQSQNIGDYLNNFTDIFFGFLGAFMGNIIIIIKQRKNGKR